MVILLLSALLLLGTAVTLALRGVATTRLRNRELLAQVGAYGFGQVGAGAETQPPTARDAVAKLAQRVGTRLERRFGADHIRQLRVLLNSAGYYRTSVARYLGYRVLA